MKLKLKAIPSLLLVGVMAMYACVDPSDLITENAKEGGGIVTLAGTSGKVLGVPDAETGEISFTDHDLTMTIAGRTGGDNVESYTVVKSVNGGTEVEVEEFTTLPKTVTLTSLDQFLSGTGATASSLRIGDVISFRVKMNLKDGRVIYSAPSNGRYNVTVNCSSDLAGSYTVTGIYNRPASGINGQVVGPRTETVTEVSPGVYMTMQTGHWTNEELGFDPCGIIFRDVCGELTIETQNLCDAYSNEISGTGTVDPVTGNLHFVYIITGGNERDYVFDFVKN